MTQNTIFEQTTKRMYETPLQNQEHYHVFLFVKQSVFNDSTKVFQQIMFVNFDTD